MKKRIYGSAIPLLGIYHRGILHRSEAEHETACSLWHSIWWQGLGIAWVQVTQECMESMVDANYEILCKNLKSQNIGKGRCMDLKNVL